MEKQTEQARKIQVVVRPSSPLLKIVVIVLIVFSTAALIALSWVRGNIRAQTEKLRDEAAAVEQENANLQEKINDLGSVQSIQDIAKEELGLVDPDTIIIDIE